MEGMPAPSEALPHCLSMLADERRDACCWCTTICAPVSLAPVLTAAWGMRTGTSIAPTKFGSKTLLTWLSIQCELVDERDVACGRSLNVQQD